MIVSKMTMMVVLMIMLLRMMMIVINTIMVPMIMIIIINTIMVPMMLVVRSQVQGMPHEHLLRGGRRQRRQHESPP